MTSVYFDYNATTPLDAGVREIMLPFLGEVYGNPSSIHRVGRRARALLDQARDRVATVLSAKPGEICFTSGGTESNNLAILGAARALKSRGRHLVTSPVEHPAVLNCFRYLAAAESFELTIIGVDAEGLVSPGDLQRALRPDTILVSIMAANNETGTVQPVAELGRICRERGVVFHTDAAQWFGKMPFTKVDQFEADLVSICGHKFHGPKGSGALYIRSPMQIQPIMLGGGQENDRRGGTENLPALMGFTDALERFVRTPVFPPDSLYGLTAELISFLQTLEGVSVRGSLAGRLPNTVCFTVEGTDSIALLAGLDLEGICASSGSACSAGALEPSHVLSAMGVPPGLANSLVRFSLGRESTLSEIETVKSVLPPLIARLRSLRLLRSSNNL